MKKRLTGEKSVKKYHQIRKPPFEKHFMPFYGRDSSDGRDRLLRDILIYMMRKNMTSSNFADEIPKSL